MSEPTKVPPPFLKVKATGRIFPYHPQLAKLGEDVEGYTPPAHVMAAWQRQAAERRKPVGEVPLLDPAMAAVAQPEVQAAPAPKPAKQRVANAKTAKMRADVDMVLGDMDELD